MIVIKKLFLLLFVTSFVFTKSNSTIKLTEPTGYIISGTVSGYEEGSIVELLNASSGQQEKTTKVVGGKFSFIGKVDFPEIMIILFNKQQPYLTLFVENSNISIAATKGMLDAAIITGSRSHNDFQEFNKIIKPYEAFFIKSTPIDSASMKICAIALEKFAMQHKSSFVSTLAIYRNFQLLGNCDKMESLFNQLDGTAKSTPVGGFILQEIAKAQKQNPVLLVFKRGKTDNEHATFKKVKFKDGIEKDKISMVTFGCNIADCKPIEIEVKQLGKKILDWKNKINFSYSVITYLSKDYDNKDSSNLFGAGFVSTFMSNSNKWKFPFFFYYYDSTNPTLEEIFGFSTTPTTILFDKNGNVFYKTKGMVSTENDLELLYSKLTELNK